MCPHPVLSSGAGREVLGHLWNARWQRKTSTKGQWSGEPHARSDWSQPGSQLGGMEGLGVLGILLVPLTMHLAQLGNQSLGSTDPLGAHKWELREQKTSKDIADRQTDRQGKTLIIGESR